MKYLPENYDRTNAFVAVAVWLTALFTYVQTLAPTLSLWDCGEFIATSYILGIPHPPGTPTFVMFGRIASLIPTFTDICARVNFLSAFCSSLAAMFAYLFGVRLIRYWFDDQKSVFNRILIYAGAASGALFLAFSRTQWNNSVEAEVYGMAMLIVFAIAWLTLIYFENCETVHGNKVLLLVTYLAFLGIGVHMSTFLVLPISVIVFILRRNTPVKYWFLIAVFFAMELFLIFAISSRPDEIPYYFPIVIAGLFYLFFMLSFDRIAWQLMAVAGGFVLACTPAFASLAGSDSSVWTIISLVGYVGLIGFGLYLITDYFKNKSRNRGDASDEAKGMLVAGIFVMVSLAMTAVTRAGLPNGPEGYHIFLGISVALAAGIGVLIWRHINLPVLIALGGPAMIVLGVREFFWGTLAALVAILILGLVFKASGWKTAILIIIMAVAGYSTHLFAPIRSAQHPYINENNPSESLDATINFFERKQYGSQSMTERMFMRRGEWINQFGNYRRMGFWHFFEEQYGLDGRTFVLLLLLGVFGAWEACRRKPEAGLYAVVLTLVTSVGLVLYMNFADGTRQTAYDAWLEVRDRDYFFTPAFMLFGLLIGLGISGVVALLRDLTRKFSAPPRNIVMASSLVLFLLPVYAVANNYYYCDRSQNYMPYDYARNILESCEPNAILFTYGDNDTFPLWCLQEVYGVRRDVKTICCALANGGWYIKQIRDYMGVKLSWNDAQIDALRPYRDQNGNTFRIQDQVVDNVIANNFRERPINFSLLATTSARKLYGVQVDSLMELNGPVFYLTNTASEKGPRVNTDRNVELLMRSGKLKYRNWTNPDVFQCETTARSITGFADKFMTTAEALLRENRIEESIEVMEFLIDSVYAKQQAVQALAAILAEQGDTARLATFGERYPDLDPRELQIIIARGLYRAGNIPGAAASLSQTLIQYPDFRRALDDLMQIYIGERDVDAMIQILQAWVDHNPEDRDVFEALRQLKLQLQEAAGSEGDSL